MLLDHLSVAQQADQHHWETQTNRVKKWNRMFSSYSKASGLAGALQVHRSLAAVLSWWCVSPQNSRKHGGVFFNDVRPLVFNSEYFNGQPRPPFTEQTVLFNKAKGFCVGGYEYAHLSTVKEAYLTYFYHLSFPCFHFVHFYTFSGESHNDEVPKLTTEGSTE